MDRLSISVTISCNKKSIDILLTDNVIRKSSMGFKIRMLFYHQINLEDDTKMERAILNRGSRTPQNRAALTMSDITPGCFSKHFM